MAEIVASGDYWRFEGDGTLRIFCVGDMEDAKSAGSEFTYFHDEWYAYQNDITAVIIADSVTNIEYGAFYECSSLLNVTIGNGVTSIGDDAFSYCGSLTSVTIPDSVTSIGDSVFSNCSELTTAVIGGGLTTIASNMFSACSALTSVTIPVSVTSIGGGAFYYCYNLTDVYYGGTETQWNAVSIDNQYNGNNALNEATVHYESVLREIPTACLHNPLAAVALTVNAVIRAVNDLRGGVQATNVPTKTSDLTNDSGFVTNAVSDLLNYYLKAETYSKTEVNTLVDGKADAATVNAQIGAKADASTVNALIGNDAGKSVRTIANEELTAQLIPANAQAALDTLQEIAAWIQSHPNDAAAINAKLTLGMNNGTEYATVKDYVEAVTNGLITLSALSAAVAGNGNA
ncbi:MAG: leucine-rich repeat domain-containing protein, partial [Oscillibacter sp.]|nr:leucine-rich repeat domain-containing protein [Oscillibacter sp.]